MTDSRHLIHLMGSEKLGQGVREGEVGGLRGMALMGSWGEGKVTLKGRERGDIQKVRSNVTHRREGPE